MLCVCEHDDLTSLRFSWYLSKGLVCALFLVLKGHGLDLEFEVLVGVRGG